MRYLWLTLTILGCIWLAACPKGDPPEDAAAEAKKIAVERANSSTPPELGQAKLDLEFASAKPGAGKQLVDLAFTVSDADGNSAAPRLGDPKQPEPDSIEADGWRYTFTPRLGQNGVSNNMLQEAFVRGYYCIDLYMPDGVKAGHFDLLNTGNLMCKGQSEVPGMSIEPVTYGERTLFLLWSAAAPDGTRAILLGLEWQPARFSGQFNVTAPDGWTYDVQYPQGTLHAYQPSQLEDWPEEFRLLALNEQEQDVEDHKKRLAELAEDQGRRGG